MQQAQIVAQLHELRARRRAELPRTPQCPMRAVQSSSELSNMKDDQVTQNGWEQGVSDISNKAEYTRAASMAWCNHPVILSFFFLLSLFSACPSFDLVSSGHRHEFVYRVARSIIILSGRRLLHPRPTRKLAIYLSVHLRPIPYQAIYRTVDT